MSSNTQSARVFGSLAWISFLTACPGCPTEGCDALQTIADGQGSAVAGIIAIQSDDVNNGCTECGFSDATIEIWSNPSSVSSDPEAKALVESAEALVAMPASSTSHQPLQPGTYLFCVRPSGISLTVNDDTLTVNIKRRFGPPSFFVAASNASFESEDFGFDVGFE